MVRQTSKTESQTDSKNRKSDRQQRQKVRQTDKSAEWRKVCLETHYARQTERERESQMTSQIFRNKRLIEVLSEK